MIRHNQCQAWEEELIRKEAKIKKLKLVATVLFLFTCTSVIGLGLFVWVMGQDISP